MGVAAARLRRRLLPRRFLQPKHPTANVSATVTFIDILTGRDTKIDIDDIYNGLTMLRCWLIGIDTETANVPFHLKVEKRLRIL
jgi:hypothetical protein